MRSISFGFRVHYKTLPQGFSAYNIYVYTVAVGGIALHVLGQVNDHDGRKWALIEKKN